MVKLLLCTLAAAVLAACVLQLRQQRLQIHYQTAELHEQIREQQAKLWYQQVQIAQVTAPNAIARSVNTHGLKLVSQSPLPKKKAQWMNPSGSPDAE